MIDASVIIALNPHENDLARLLEAYGHQTAPVASFEIILVNGGARWDAAEAYAQLRRSLPRLPLRLLKIGRPGRAAANNAGARAAQSELLLFIADDLIPCTTLVRAHIGFHRHVAARAIGIGPAYFADAMRQDPFRRWLEDSGALFGIPFRMAANKWAAEFFYAGNASMQRTLFEEAGGFDEEFEHDLVEDFEFSLRLRRLGACSHLLPKARAWHDHELTLADRVEVQRRCGIAARQVYARHGRIAQWTALCEQPLEALLFAARRAEQHEALASTPETRAVRFQALLNLAFAQGFHAVETVSGPTPEVSERALRE
jgi:GT2 family glycosyltransferase